jgi:hypothetical protein
MLQGIISSSFLYACSVSVSGKAIFFAAESLPLLPRTEEREGDAVFRTIARGMPTDMNKANISIVYQLAASTCSSKTEPPG